MAKDGECPIPGLPSIRFDLRLSRESEADRASGRVGADPAAILKPPASTKQALARRASHYESGVSRRAHPGPNLG